MRKFKCFLILLLGIATLLSSCNIGEPPEIGGMVYVSPGDFTMGSNEEDTNSLAKEFGARQKVFFMNERPVRTLHIKGYYIDKFEVTNKEYKRFITKTRYLPPPGWLNGSYNAGRDNHSVFNVSWFDAEVYCRFMDKRLPTEEEWEKAARGPKGYKYPWGNEFDEKKANFREGDTVPVGDMSKDKSEYGVYDMAGNLMEWTSDWYKPYPGSTFKLDEYGEKYKVLRGGTGSVVGHYNLVKIFSRTSYRHYYFPNGKTADVGFRCAKEI